jgi:hypothetical protein
LVNTSQLKSKLKATTEKEPTTKISGILTSQIRSKPSSEIPYKELGKVPGKTKLVFFMAFLRPDYANFQHSLAECEKIKCQRCEIPVIFRVKPKTEFCSSGFHKEDIDCSKC